MKERPILFSAPMVRAILAGLKTATRRVVKGNHGRVLWNSIVVNGYGGWCDEHGRPVPCPYGQPGDRLWVRETFCIENTYDYHGDHIDPSDGRPIQKHENVDGNYWLIPHYRATEPEPHIVPYRCDADDDKTRWAPSIFMPRWASRITLEITGVRVERLQDITRGDCMAEGCPFPNMAHGDNPRFWYAGLWDDINGNTPAEWKANPLVWVIEFRRVEPNA